MSSLPVDAGCHAAVFDLDGTLVDSVADIHAATAVYLTEIGHAPLDLATITGFVGSGVPILMERVLRAVGEPCDAESVAVRLPRFLEIYGAAPAALSRLFPGVATALATLCESGLILAVCTNKPEAPARQMLKELGIAGFFAAVTGGDTLAERKPDPAPLRHTAQQLGVDLSAVAYIGDSEVDAATAQAAGVPFLLFTEGYRKTPADTLPQRARFSDFAELPELLAALRATPAV
jgi:phosphoglycolate phosphatase